MMLLPLGVMIFFAKEPPDREHQSFKEHIACLWEKDGWVFNMVYIITFGGFIGLSTFLPSFFYAQFHVTKIQAGQLTTLAAIMGSALRVVGGYVSDRIGGIVTLSVVLLLAIGLLLLTSTAPSLVLTTILFMLCFSSLGMGNGALFQLVPLRWPLTTAVAGSMIGEIGALGGAILPNAMGLSKTYTGSFAVGFVLYSMLAAVVLITLQFAQRKWVGRWVGKGGKPLEMPSVLTTEGATAAGMASA
jgi:NNP family nitrate/nitrite transporter-like MFS transporter